MYPPNRKKKSIKAMTQHQANYRSIRSLQQTEAYRYVEPCYLLKNAEKYWKNTEKNTRMKK